MKKIRFLRDVTTTHVIGTSGQIVTERKLGEAYQRVNMAIDPKECVFVTGEEIETFRLQVEGAMRLVSSHMDKRHGAILDDATEGTDFEFID